MVNQLVLLTWIHIHFALFVVKKPNFVALKEHFLIFATLKAKTGAKNLK